MEFIIHMHVKKNQPILVRVLQAYQTFFFSLVNRLKQNFLQTTFSLLTDTENSKIQRRLIYLSKTEKRVRSQRPAAHILSSFLYRIGLFVRPQTQRERNVVQFSAAVCEEERCVTTLKTAVQQTNVNTAVIAYANMRDSGQTTLSAQFVKINSIKVNEDSVMRVFNV